MCRKIEFIVAAFRRWNVRKLFFGWIIGLRKLNGLIRCGCRMYFDVSFQNAFQALGYFDVSAFAAAPNRLSPASLSASSEAQPPHPWIAGEPWLVEAGGGIGCPAWPWRAQEAQFLGRSRACVGCSYESGSQSSPQFQGGSVRKRTWKPASGFRKPQGRFGNFADFPCPNILSSQYQTTSSSHLYPCNGYGIAFESI